MSPPPEEGARGDPARRGARGDPSGLVPSRIGPYVLLEVVSKQAFCVTYRARHEELGRTVLLKTLKPTVSVSSPFSQALDREAKILAGLRHEGIVALYDFVRTRETMWLALEDVRGHTLGEVLSQRRRIGVEPAVAVALEVARGLSHAHERGTVHRDLRPENVVLLDGGGVKIIEFAAALGGRMPTSPEPFEGEAFARPDYMAPEQILGDAPGPRADVFSLGVLMYEMLSGERPFEEAGEDDRREGERRSGERRLGDRRETARGEGERRGGERRETERRSSGPRVSRGSPPPLGVVAPEVPRSIESVVMRCLARDPEDRYESGRAVAAALEEALSELTRVPVRVLVSRALAAAKLGEELHAPGAPAPAEPFHTSSGRALRQALPGYLAIFGLIVLGALVIELGLRDKDRAASLPLSGPGTWQGRAEARGHLRVLAKPWAEVLIDGELVDTTPIGRPIAVSPGRHYVTFRHPNAPDEKRSIQIESGQTVVLDVTMRIDRGPALDAGTGPGAAADAEASP